MVIVGAGFGGIAVARGLGSGNADVTLIDRENYHVFQPLLYQVATAVLSPADIAEPTRRMLRYRNVTVMLGEVVSISVNEKCLALADGEILPYDILVVAAGAVSDFYGHDDWKPFALSLKSIPDARTIRSRLLRAFEEAEKSHDAAEKSA